MNWLMPGDAVKMPILEGPGVINHFWMTSHSGWVNELNSLVLRIYWDGNSKPGVFLYDHYLETGEALESSTERDLA